MRNMVGLLFWEKFMGKPFKNIEEQIEILKERGMVIKDKDYASRVLLHVNYYRLIGYTLTLRRYNIFYNNVKLEQVMEIYNFDTELRVITEKL
ncbi:hypothetical protein FDB28_03815 [Clostridium botulinum]|nr:hypothetical protein [Clostridium botulinum]NFS97575.1 hypothetical protein [Clostridium botulinum]